MKRVELEKSLQVYEDELFFNEFASRTIKKYIVDSKRFIDFLDHDNDITKRDVISYKQDLMQKYKPKTINSYLISLNKYLKFIGLGDFIAKMLKIQEEYSFGEIINDSEFKRLMRYSKSDQQLHMIMTVIKSTGCRISEIRFITIEALNNMKYTEKVIPIRSKGKNRFIIITSDARSKLLKYCKNNNITSGRIFTYSYSTIWRHMKKTAGKARIKKSKVYPHVFRHYFAKLYLQNYNNNILELADILGHSSVETTRIYTRSTNEEKRLKMEQL